jgi:hypothetical protein
MASNNQNSTGGDLAAMMEADAKAREADFAKADALIKQVPDALKVDDCEKAVDLCSRALKLKFVNFSLISLSDISTWKPSGKAVLFCSVSAKRSRKRFPETLKCCIPYHDFD